MSLRQGHEAIQGGSRLVQFWAPLDNSLEEGHKVHIIGHVTTLEILIGVTIHDIVSPL